MTSRRSSTTRYGGQRWYWRFYGIGLFALGVWLLVEANRAGTINGYTIYGVVLGWIVLGVGAGLTPAWRRITFNDRALRIPRILGSVKIPVEEVAGIGLIYCYWPWGTGYNKASSWDLFVWRTNGSYVSDFAVSWVNLERQAGNRWKPRQLNDEVVASMIERVDARRIADSKPARIAADIYGRIIAAQGPTGPLATRQLQKHE